MRPHLHDPYQALRATPLRKLRELDGWSMVHAGENGGHFTGKVQLSEVNIARHIHTEVSRPTTYIMYSNTNGGAWAIPDLDTLCNGGTNGVESLYGGASAIVTESPSAENDKEERVEEDNDSISVSDSSACIRCVHSLLHCCLPAN